MINWVLFFVYLGRAFQCFFYIRTPTKNDVSKITNRRENNLGSCFVPPKLHGRKYHDGPPTSSDILEKESHLKNGALLLNTMIDQRSRPNWQTSMYAGPFFFLIIGRRWNTCCVVGSAFPKSTSHHQLWVIISHHW